MNANKETPSTIANLLDARSEQGMRIEVSSAWPEYHARASRSMTARYGWRAALSEARYMRGLFGNVTVTRGF
jgi:hypothetical protein